MPTLSRLLLRSLQQPGTMAGGTLVYSWSWGLIGLVVGGCASLTQLSEEGGLAGRILAHDELSEPGDSVGNRPAVVPGDTGSQLEPTVPYRPADFDEHAADGEFTWHWTAARAGDRVEVKGLIEKRVGSAVQGVTLALSGSGTVLRQEVPGLIRPGQLRPFYFAAAFSGDERKARLSIVAVDRSPGAPEAGPATPVALRPEGRAATRSSADSFTGRARDHFFNFYWNTTEKGGEIEVSGLVENRNGPMVKEVTLLITAHDAAGKTLKTQRVVLRGSFDKKATRPFTATFPVAIQPERVNVWVESYDFYQPKDK